MKIAVMAAGGVALAADYARDRLAYAEASPPDTKASMLDDLERGKRLELDWLAGEVSRLGRKLAIPTPELELERVAVAVTETVSPEAQATLAEPAEPFEHLGP